MFPMKLNLFGKQNTKVLLKNCTDSRHHYYGLYLLICLHVKSDLKSRLWGGVGVFVNGL